MAKGLLLSFVRIHNLIDTLICPICALARANEAFRDLTVKMMLVKSHILALPWNFMYVSWWKVCQNHNRMHPKLSFSCWLIGLSMTVFLRNFFASQACLWCSAEQCDTRLFKQQMIHVYFISVVSRIVISSPPGNPLNFFFFVFAYCYDQGIVALILINEWFIINFSFTNPKETWREMLFIFDKMHTTTISRGNLGFIYIFGTNQKLCQR